MGKQPGKKDDIKNVYNNSTGSIKLEMLDPSFPKVRGVTEEHSI